MTLDEDVDFRNLPGLSHEIRTKLDAVRPRTIGQAARIEGMTPAAITLLAAHVRRSERELPPSASSGRNARGQDALDASPPGDDVPGPG